MNLSAQFKEFLLSQANPPSKVTVKNYSSDLNKFLKWTNEKIGNFDPGDISSSLIDNFKRESLAKYSPSSVERSLSSLRKFFHFLKVTGQISHSPFDLLASPQTLTKRDIWRIKDFKNHLFVLNSSHLTIKNYIIDIKQFVAWAEEVLRDKDSWEVSETEIFAKVDSNLIEEYKRRLLSQLGLSPVSVNRKLSSLRRYFSWAKQEGIIPVEAQISSLEGLRKYSPIPTSNQQSRSPTIGQYSLFPPLRLIQKMKLATVSIFDGIFTYPLSQALEKFEEIAWKLKGKPVFKEAQKSTPHGPSSIIYGQTRNFPKSFYAPTRISTKYLPLHKKIWHHARFTRPNWYRKYHSYTFVSYLHFSVLMLFISALGYSLFSSLNPQRQQPPTFAALPSSPQRILSFQGRLTDANDNPITSTTAVRMAIYNSATASGSALLWQEIVSPTPDQDGIFSVILGKNTAIPQSLFAQNSALWLGVTIEQTQELIPRHQIATVAFAVNAETLQGLPPITNTTATSNVVLALNSSGNLSIGGTASPAFQATGGTFTLAGKTLVLSTISASNGDIRLTPDGSGSIDAQKALKNTSNNGSVIPGAVEVHDIFAVLATTSAQAAFNINQASTNNLITASTSGVTKFFVGNSGAIFGAGNLDIDGGSNDIAGTLNLSGNTLTSGSNLTINATSGYVRIGDSASPGNASGDDDLFVEGDLEIDAVLYADGTIDTAFTSNGGILYTNASGVIAQVTAGTTSQCLLGGTAPSFGSCATGAGSNWRLSNGALSPINDTLDLLIGNSATASAKFGFLNVNSGTPTASISANSGNNATTLSGLGVLGTVNAQTLTLGNSTTGDVVIDAGSGNVNLVDATASRFILTDANKNLTYSGASSVLLNTLSDETGTGVAVFGTSPDITTSITTGSTTFALVNTTATTVNFAGAATDINLGVTGATSGTFDVLGGSGDTGCTIQGSNGSLTCSGDIIGGTTGTQGYWQRASGSLAPTNITDDLLLGATSTTSAKFGFLNVAGGTPTASISANSGNNATFFTGGGNLATTNKQTLTLGGSTTGFINVNNSAASPFTTFDTLNSFVGIGTTAPKEKLALAEGIFIASSGGRPETLGGTEVGQAINDILVSGKYAYTINDSDASTGREFRITDISNPYSPVEIGGLDFGQAVNPQSIVIQGKYAFIAMSDVAGTCSGTTLTGCELRVYDISNPSSISAVGGLDTSGVKIDNIQLSGKYLYAGLNANSGTEFRIYDISTPTAITEVGSGIEVGQHVNELFIQGKYAYIVNDTDAGSGNEFRVIDISNPLTPSAAGGVNLTVEGGNIYVSGRYAYITTAAGAGTCSGTTTDGCEFRIYDVSNPASPSSVSGIDEGVRGQDIYVSGNYAYYATNTGTGDDFEIVDVSTPASPSDVGGIDVSATIFSVWVSGKYIYLGTNTVSGNEFRIIDAPGILVPLANIGSIATNYLNVSENARIENSLYVGNGLNIGEGGFLVSGQGAIYASSVSTPAFVVNNTGSGDLFTASASGTTRFTLANDGDLTLTGGDTITASSLATFTTAATLGMTSTTTLNLGTNATITSAGTALNLQSDGTIDVNIAGGSSTTGCTIANASGNLTCSGNFISNATTGTNGHWNVSSGAIFPRLASTLDLLIGGSSTSSAQFSITGVNDSRPTLTLAGGTRTTGPVATIAAAFNPSGGGTQTGLSLAFQNNPNTSANTFRGLDINVTDNTSLLANQVYGLYVNTDLVSTGSAKIAGAFNGGSILQTPTNPVYTGGSDTVSGNTGNDDVNRTFISGRYLYIVKDINGGTCSSSTSDGCEFQIYDISNPSSPTFVGGSNITNNTNSVYVSGRYAYIGKNGNSGTCSSTTSTGCEFQIYDISNPSNPYFLGGADSTTGAGADHFNSVYISGRYAYIGKAENTGTCSSSDRTGCEFQIYDVSNSTSPVFVGGADMFGSGGSSDINEIYVSGKHAYIVKDGDGATCSSSVSQGCELQIYDISDPSKPAYASGADVSTGAGNVSMNSVYVSGRFAYVTRGGSSGTCSSSTRTGCELQIHDVSNPYSPSYLGGAESGVTGTADDFNSVFVSGRYAYVAKAGNAGTCSSAVGTGCEFQIFDVLTPSSPTYLGGQDAATGSEGTSGVNTMLAVYVSGKYAYIGKAGNSAGVCTSTQRAGCEIQIYDVTGIEATSVLAHSLEAGTFQVRNDATIGNQLNVLGGITAGAGGILSQGALSIYSTSSAQLVLDGKTTGKALAIFNETGNQDIFTASASGTTRFVIQNAGNVGIGTALPGFALDLQNSQSATGAAQIFNTNTGTDADGLIIKLGNSSTTAVSTTNHFISFETSGIGIVGSIQGNGGKNVAYVTNGIADFAEYMKKDPSEDIEWGSILCQSINGNVTPCSGVSPNIVGVASELPTFVGGENLGTGSITVGLTGIVSTKVSNINGDISSGDYITSSNIPGVGVKASGPGAVVGIALKDHSSSESSKILVRVNPSWYDPDVQLADNGYLSLGPTVDGDFQVKRNTGETVQRIGAFSDLVVARIKSGYFETGKFIVTGSASVKNLTAETLASTTANFSQLTTDSLAIATENFSVAGQNIRDYISTIVDERFSQTQTSQVSLISPIQIEEKNVVAKLPSHDSKFEIRNSSNSAVASIDSEGNASISGKLTADSGQFNNLTVEQLNNTGDATVSGTLRAGKIIASDIELSEEALLSLLGLEQQSSPSATYALNYGPFWSDPNASPSAIQPWNDGIVEQLALSQLTVTSGFMSFGPASFFEASIADRLFVGAQLSLADRSINVLGGNLELQPLKQGGIAFVGGEVEIDSSGNLRVNGNATFVKNVEIYGKLASNIIAPIPGQDLFFELNESFGSGRININNASNSAVLTINSYGDINASGSGSFSKLKLSFVPEVLAVSDTQVIATGSAGTAEIKENQDELTIVNPLVTEDSLIYITPKTSIPSQSLYLLRQVAENPNSQELEGSFTVGLSEPLNKKIPFNWIIIN